MQRGVVDVDNYHITKGNKGWKLTKEGNERATKTAETKKDIIQQAREHMANKTGSVKIHKEDGKIQEERTYQRKDDPRKSKG